MHNSEPLNKNYNTLLAHRNRDTLRREHSIKAA
jgi:hypothetical protein